MSSQKIPLDYWEFKSITGVVIIPIKNNAPVLIFKNYGTPFYSEIGGPGSKMGLEEPHALNNYLVHWKNKLYMHDLPKCIEKQYGNFFANIIKTPSPSYSKIYRFPQDCFELPIHLFENHAVKIDGRSKELKNVFNHVKTVLREWGFISNLTGKIKSDAIREKRDALIFKEIVNRKNRYRSIGELQKKITDFLEEKNLSRDQYEKYLVTDTQIHRIIKKEEKRKRGFEKWLQENVPF